jgi:hypothetical protein
MSSAPTAFPTARPSRAAWLLGLPAAALAGLLAAQARGTDIEREPIRYNDAPADNAVSRLQSELDAGRVSLDREERHGHLRALLRRLGVPESSQVLVFSKTSLQRQRIAPATPRAVYFSDDVYVGYCQSGAVMEVSASDPRLGTVFYTLGQEPGEKPRFVRQQDSCLICHASSQNQGMPGHLVRSVYADAEGFPILSSGSYRTDQRSPLAQRWGGWYVTGTSGRQVHLGNLVVRDKRQPEQVDNAANTNLTDLGGRFDTSPYLTPHSDIVALMVLEHQAEMHNLLTRANFLTRAALYDEAALNKELGRPADHRSDSTLSRVRSAGEPVVKYLLFSGEAKLTDPVQGTSGFAREFARRGPRDARGRSLRDLDLRRRLFTYPCSYLIYSREFEALPAPVKAYVLRRVWDVLTGKEAGEGFAHLTADDRRAIREILLATKPNLPDYWRAPAAGP